MRLTILLLLCGWTTTPFAAQVSITTTGIPPDPSSMLDIRDQTRGLLVPRMSLAQRDVIVQPANALLIYQTDNEPGFYFNRGTPDAPEWVSLTTLSDVVHLEDRIPIDSLPYDITTPGSYYLTSDLNGATGINIMTSNVTLDLNGYAIRGTPGNNSQGIEVTTTATNIHVRNGSVVNWGREGIKAVAATSSTFSQLHIISSALDGIATGNNVILISVLVSGSGFDGIDAGQSNTINTCVTYNNGNDGIEADPGSNLWQCTTRDNGAAGVRTTGASTIASCTSAENNAHGFVLGSGSVITNSTASHNVNSGFYLFSACTATNNNARSNDFEGFEWLNDCVLTSNIATLNGRSGFFTDAAGGRLENNTSNTNSLHGYSIQTAGGCLIIKNAATGNGVSAFNVTAGNSFATVITAATLNTNTNPFANFQF